MPFHLKIILSFFALLPIPLESIGQIQWESSLESAKEKAIKEHKLIVIDFYADWCAPCRAMERQFWNTPEMITISKNFVSFKADSQLHNTLIDEYGIASFPTIILVDISGAFIWKYTGFDPDNLPFATFAAIPTNIKKLNNALLALNKQKKGLKDYINRALAYQDIGKLVSNTILRTRFLTWSNRYLKKTLKTTGISQKTSTKIRLHVILNRGYMGKTKSMLKKLKKIEIAPEDKENSKLKHFVFSELSKT